MKKSLSGRGGLAATGLIILLAASAVFLLFFGNRDLLRGGEETEIYVRAAEEPLSVLGVSAVASFNGAERVGAAYDREALARAEAALREPLRRALDTAADPAETDGAEWRLALANPGVYVTFFGELPAEVLWDTLGAADCPLTERVRAAVLSARADADAVILYFKCGEDRFVRLTTRLETSALSAFAFEGASPVRLAAELGSPYTERLSPDMLFSDEQAFDPLRREPGFSFRPENSEELSRLLALFGINPYTDPGYTAERGARVYRSGAGVLTVFPSGRVRFLAEEGLPAGLTGERPLLADAVRAADRLLRTAAGSGSLVSCFLYSAEREGDAVRLSFGVAVGGVRLRDGTEYPEAVVEISGGRILRADFILYRLAADSRLSAEPPAAAMEIFAAYMNEKIPGDLPELCVYAEEDRGVYRWIV